VRDQWLCALVVTGVLGLAGQAWAGETPCVYERGVVIVPAEVMGIAGDFILDTGSARTQIAETQAEGAGLTGPELAGEVRVAGLARQGQPVQVADLDARTVFLTTPIAGVIGVDALRDLVLDIRFSPCRVWIGQAAAAPRFPRAVAAQMGWAGGLPVVQAAVGDGLRSWPAEFTPATGLDLSVRLDDRLANAQDAPKPQELYPGGVARSRLAALVFMGDRYTELDAGLMKGPLETPWPAGWIGGPVLSRYRLRFDFPAGQLLAARAR
jgi:hypothetical protein